jgi:hypothetical protein
MQRLILALMAAVCVATAAGAADAAPAPAVAADAAPPLVFGVDHPGDAALLDAQFFIGSHGYCWYDSAWRGPGFYWCGSQWRRGVGWGGPAGWRGWASGPRFWRGGVWIGPRNYRNRDWRGWNRGGRPR